MNEIIYYAFKDLIIFLFLVSAFSGIVTAIVEEDEVKRLKGVVNLILSAALAIGVMRIL